MKSGALHSAGKSTLVKLLCGFYMPEAGRILVDGLDLASLDIEDWRRRLSAGFQDFNRFEFLLRESVGVGAVDRVTDAEAVAGAMQRAGGSDLPSSVPGGLEGQLGRQFDGAELSGGQWQKVALSRAMMREEPLLLVLDEPTSALDAFAEHRLFERYSAGARDIAQRTGGITILVSHRFSTVRMADLILVIDGGRIVERGGHEELIRRNGLYAELHEIQAKAYR